MFDDTIQNSDSSSIDSRTAESQSLVDADDHPFTSIEAIQGYDWSNFDCRSAERKTVKPHTDPTILAYSYWIKGLTQTEIGRRYGVGQQSISYQMDKQGIPTEAHPSHFQATLSYSHEAAKGGTYDWIWSCCNGNRYDTYVHHLVACVDNDPHEVFSEETDVHHETGHPLDNRPDALSVVERSEHPKPRSRNSEWIIENGEPRLRMNPEADTPNPAKEWWTDADDYGPCVGKSNPQTCREAVSGESQGSGAVVDGD